MSKNKIVVIALILGALLLVDLSLLSRDSNKQNFIAWKSLYDRLNLLSYQMDNGLLKLRGGLNSNYDEITETAEQIKILKDEMKQREIDDEARSQSRLRFVSEDVLTADTGALRDLLEHRLELVDEFKNLFLISSNSENIAEQMINELRAMGVEEAGWADHINELEKFVLYIDSSTNNTFVKIISQMKARSTTLEQTRLLDNIQLHLNGMNKNVFRIRILVADNLRTSNSIKAEINQLNDKLTRDYKQFSGALSFFQWLLFVQAFLFVSFGTYLAIRVMSFSRKLKDQNANLDKLVHERTQELVSETVAKEGVIKDLKRKEKQIQKSRKELGDLVNSIDGIVWRRSARKGASYRFISDQVEVVLGFKPEDLVGEKVNLDNLIHPDDVSKVEHAFCGKAGIETDKFQVEYRIQLHTGRIVHIRNIITPVCKNKSVTEYRGIMFDVTRYKDMSAKQQSMEVQLRQAQKLEAVGQLAAGIAHEINTPTQFVGDNIHYFQDAFVDIDELLTLHDQLLALLAQEQLSEESKLQVEKIVSLIKKIDLAFIREDIPDAIAQALDGVSRISTIVKAMKEFSHPGGEGKENIDLNRAINSTMTVARNEWKYVANLVTEFDPDLPSVECLPGEINQVILNMIVNAAHAIEGRKKLEGTSDLGTITIDTLVEGDYAVIRIGDTGAGISKENLQKIFDPFFTTKEVGKGTGQGLYIAHSVIVEKHGGQLEVESELGKGTRFTIKLPIEAVADEPAERLKQAS